MKIRLARKILRNSPFHKRHKITSEYWWVKCIMYPEQGDHRIAKAIKILKRKDEISNIQSK